MSHYGSESTAKESYVNYNPSKSSGSDRSGTSGGTEAIGTRMGTGVCSGEEAPREGLGS
jgi:hypothetical protein